jgi:hypothetical protein
VTVESQGHEIPSPKGDRGVEAAALGYVPDV